MQANNRKKMFPNVSDEQWNDWKWQVKNRIETLDELKKYIPLTPEEEEGVKESLGTLRMAITPYYLSLINPNDPNDPVRKQSIPTFSKDDFKNLINKRLGNNDFQQYKNLFLVPHLKAPF